MNESRRAELARASAVFQLALVRLGAEAGLALLRLYRDQAPGRIITGQSGWSRRALGEVVEGRTESLALGQAYYRLARALETGRTVAPVATATRPTLGDLRREFDREADKIIRRTPGGSVDRLYPSPLPDDRLAVSVDVLPALAEPEAVRKAAEEAALSSLERMGVANLQRRMRRVNEAAGAAQATETSAATQAAAGARHVMNGARGRLVAAGQADRRVIGYVRLSRTGTPCGFCAMLLSRGFTPKSGIYGSEQSAGGPYMGPDQYHDNCQCYAEPVYSRQQMSNDPRFALNREYAVLWPQVTKGYGGKGALNAWRRYITKQTEAQVAEAA